MTNVSVNEGDTDVGTYTLTEIEDGPAVTWSLDETGTSDFMLEGTGMSRMLKFSSAPDYETPMGGAANDSNTYMVTVKGRGRRRNGDGGSHHHRRQRGGGRNGNPDAGAAQRWHGNNRNPG